MNLASTPTYLRIGSALHVAILPRAPVLLVGSEAVPPRVNVPTTSAPLSHLTDQATAAMRPWMVLLVVTLVLSALLEEFARTRRRRKRAPKRRSSARRVRQTRIRRARQHVDTAHSSTAVATPIPSIAPVCPSVVGSGDTPSSIGSSPGERGSMWGRRPGQHVGERLSELDRERTHWEKGLEGETCIGAEIDRLPTSEWWVFHSIPRGKSGTDIDHLVIGVGGVFTINSKNVSGSVWVAERVLMVAGNRTNYLPAAVHEAHDVARRLSGAAKRSISVHPLLVFTRPITVKARPTEVGVLELAQLRRWFVRQPRVLSSAEAYEIAVVACEPSIWG